jgi:hypothetical protein
MQVVAETKLSYVVTGVRLEIDTKRRECAYLQVRFANEHGAISNSEIPLYTGLAFSEAVLALGALDALVARFLQGEAI